ncbi:MAG: 4Fe-4S binding protein [Acidobacteria bacterium]|nr:4Fe-4S binding protein [Acidobacteriota bacterium]
MRATARHLRIASQAAFLLAFLALVWLLAEPRVRGEVTSILLAIDPLTSVGTILGDWTVPRWAWIGLIILALTAFAGRFFCGWVCPLGTLQQLVSRVASPRRRLLLERNRYRRWFATKYMILAILLVSAALGSLHTGWLDPIALLHRTMASAVRPFWHGGVSPGGWISFAMVATILLLSAWMPRFFCRALCPLGALLGLFARLAPIGIRRDEAACNDCKLCLIPCQGADEPLGEHRVSECHLCLNCLYSCPENGLGFGVRAQPATGVREPALDVGRRRFLLTTVAAVAVTPVLRAAGGGLQARSADAIRPPGALGEGTFLARCITCGACVAACPTGALLPDLGRTGVDGLFTPVLVPRRGWCEPSCTRCGEVCPTGAIAEVTAKAKQAINGPAEVTIGTAFVDRGRCLPWAMDTPCIVCEEMCPTSPKAVWLQDVEAVKRDGSKVRLQRPHLQPELCTGCGLCENRCPVGELAAIRVSSVGESRDPQNRLLQQSGLAVR